MADNDTFPSMEAVREMLDDIQEDLPPILFEELNGGVLLFPEHKLHPESRKEDKLFIKGEYHRSPILGRQIIIYYGTFKRLYETKSEKKIYRELKKTLHHEFVHHIESLGGEKDLEIDDAIRLEAYRRKIDKKEKMSNTNKQSK